MFLTQILSFTCLTFHMVASSNFWKSGKTKDRLHLLLVPPSLFLSVSHVSKLPRGSGKERTGHYVNANSTVKS